MEAVPPSLTDHCIKLLKKSQKFKSTEGLLSIYAKLDSENPQFVEVRELAKRGLCERFPMLLEKYGIEEMRLIFDPEDLLRFEQEHRKSLEVKKIFSSLKGTVMEPTAAADTKQRSDGTYPVEVLLQGAAWPEGIDYSIREQYLSDRDFENIFKMSKTAFMAKDKFVRMRLKKENRLF